MRQEPGGPRGDARALSLADTIIGRGGRRSAPLPSRFRVRWPCGSGQSKISSWLPRARPAPQERFGINTCHLPCRAQCSSRNCLHSGSRSEGKYNSRQSRLRYNNPNRSHMKGPSRRSKLNGDWLLFARRSSRRSKCRQHRLGRKTTPPSRNIRHSGSLALARIDLCRSIPRIRSRSKSRQNRLHSRNRNGCRRTPPHPLRYTCSSRSAPIPRK